MVLRLLFANSRLTTIWIDKVAVLTRILLHKGLIDDELLCFYDIYVTHTKFLDEICNLLVLINRPTTESVIRSIFKDASDVA